MIGRAAVSVPADPEPAPATQVSLRSILAPLTPEWLIDHLRAPELRVERGSRERFREFPDWPAMRAMIEAGSIAPHQVRVARSNGEEMSRFFFLDRDTVCLDKLEAVIAAAGSIIANGIHRASPAVAAIAAELRALVPDNIQATAVVSGGTGTAIPLHYDLGDVIVLQIEGAE